MERCAGAVLGAGETPEEIAVDRLLAGRGMGVGRLAILKLVALRGTAFGWRTSCLIPVWFRLSNNWEGVPVFGVYTSV